MNPMNHLWLVGILLIVLSGSCGPKPTVKPESVLDTPETHYAQGKRLLEKGKTQEAMFEFQRAKALDPKYAPAYEGIGLAYLAWKDARRAEENMKRAKALDKRYVPAYVGLGRVYVLQKRYDDALGQYEDALKLDPHSVDAYFYRGETYRERTQYSRAERAYQAALEIDPTNARVDAAWKEVGRLKRARAGASKAYAQIAQSPAITRADVAALFVSELPLNRIFRKAAKPSEGFRPPGATSENAEREPSISDIQNTWAKSPIKQVVTLGLMELYGDGTFRPNEQVTRAELAMLLQRILIADARDPNLATQFIGNTSLFSDVPGSHPAFNAISLMVSRGVMQGHADGTFHPYDPVSGTDALLIIRALKDQLK